MFGDLRQRPRRTVLHELEDLAELSPQALAIDVGGVGLAPRLDLHEQRIDVASLGRLGAEIEERQLLARRATRGVG